MGLTEKDKVLIKLLTFKFFMEIIKTFYFCSSFYNSLSQPKRTANFSKKIECILK
jgi:hypothetical protein